MLRRRRKVTSRFAKVNIEMLQTSESFKRRIFLINHSNLWQKSVTFDYPYTKEAKTMNSPT